MMELQNEYLAIRCDRCGHINYFSSDEFDIESYAEERSMGYQIEFYISDERQCEKCGKDFRFRISGWEYPEGAYNYENNEIDGGEFEEEPSMELVYLIDEFDVQAAYDEYDKVRDLICRIANDETLIYDISSREFEEIVERIFQDNGFETTLTQATHDGGKDIIATKSVMGRPVVYYIECKKYSAKNTIGVDIVRQLYGVQSADKINKGVIATTAHFSPEARQFAENQNKMIDLIEINEIIRLIRNSAR